MYNNNNNHNFVTIENFTLLKFINNLFIKKNLIDKVKHTAKLKSE